MSGINVEL